MAPKIFICDIEFYKYIIGKCPFNGHFPVKLSLYNTPLKHGFGYNMVMCRVGVIKIVIVINCNLITFSKVIACNCN